MQINVTFVIQIINFWISYAMLHKLLFKPFVRLIDSKQAARNTLIRGLKAKEQTLVQLQDDKKKNVDIFQAYIKKQYAFTTPIPKDLPATFVFTCTQDEINTLIDAEKKLILQKVPHAY